MDILVPDMYQKSIYSIDYIKLKEEGIKCILFDLDNTCIPYVETKPSKKLIELIEYLEEINIKAIIFSNSGKKRLEPFKNELGIDCCSKCMKPLKYNFLKIIKKFNLDLSEVAIIGDQLMTDIWGGNKVGIKTILVNPISYEDRFTTKFWRFFENKQFKLMKKKDILVKGRYYD